MTSVDPDSIIVAEGAVKKLGGILVKYQRPLFVTDVVIYDKYRKTIENGIEADIVWAISPDYQKGLASHYPSVDIIVGFGGGKSIDMAKIISMDANLDWISVPTAASHDGIASNVASVMQNGYRYSEKCKSPIIILADLSIMATAPDILTLSGIGDIICKASSLAEWKLASEYNDEDFDPKAFAIVDSALDAVLKDDSLDILVKAIIDTGKVMTDFGSSRPCSGTEHAISHAMDRRMSSLHGLQVAFATPLCLHFLDEAGYATHSTEQVRTYLIEKEMPTTLKELDMTKGMFLDDIRQALKIMERRSRYSVLAHCKTTDSKLKNTFEKIGY